MTPPAIWMASLLVAGEALLIWSSSSRMKIKLSLTLIFSAFTFYCLGAGLMEHFRPVFHVDDGQWFGVYASAP